MGHRFIWNRVADYTLGNIYLTKESRCLYDGQQFWLRGVGNHMVDCRLLPRRFVDYTVG